LNHHAPAFRSVAPRYATDILTAAFASNMLTELLGEATVRNPAEAASDGDATGLDSGARSRVDLVIHGHVHNSADYHVGPTRVICNPHGYGSENAAFNPALIVEV